MPEPHKILHFAEGNYRDVIALPADIHALFCAPKGKDVHTPDRVFRQIPIVDMQSIPPEPLKDAAT